MAGASQAIPNVLEDIASSGSALAAAGNMSGPRRKLAFTTRHSGPTSAVRSPAVSPIKVLAGFSRKPEDSKYEAQTMVRESHVVGQTCLDQAAKILRRKAYMERCKIFKAKEDDKRNAAHLLESRKKQDERAAKADAVAWALANKGAPIVRRKWGLRGHVQCHVRDSGLYSGTDRMKDGLNMSRDNHLVSINMQARLSVWVCVLSILGSISVSLLAPSLFSLALRSSIIALNSVSLSLSAV